MKDTSGENTGGPEPESAIPADPVPAGPQQGPSTADEGLSRPHDLTPYLALIISCYEATDSLLMTAAAAVIVVVAAIADRRSEIHRRRMAIPREDLGLGPNTGPPVAT